MSARKRFLLHLSVLLTVALLGRLVGAWWWQARAGAGEFGFPDSWSYWTLAEAVSQGESYQLAPDQQVFRTPGYPLLLAPLFWVVPAAQRIFAARVLGVLLGVGAVALVVGCTRRLFDEPTALLAGWMAALYPGAIAMSVFILSEAPFCPAMMGHLWLWSEAAQSPRPKSAAGLALAGGLVAGVATLIRPSWLLFTPFAAGIWIVFAQRRSKAALLSLAMLVGMCVAMAPWWVRNYLVVGQFVPTTLQVGASLYDGLNPRATGASDMSYVPEFRNAQKAEDVAQGRDPAGYEARVDRRLRDAAMRWAADHPTQVMALAATKFVRLWNIWPNLDEFRSWPLRVLVMVGFVPLLVAGIVGLIHFAPKGWPVVLLTMPAVYFTLLHMVFVGSLRYRQPPMLALTTLAAAGVIHVLWPRLFSSKAATATHGR